MQRHYLVMKYTLKSHYYRVDNLRVLITKKLEDVVQSHSTQVKDLIEAQ